MNRLRAFTIIEIVVVLLLSTIVIGIAYLSYTVIGKQYSRFVDETNAMTRIMHLDRALAADFLRSETIELTPDGFNCIQADTNINYYFADSMIIRSFNKIAVDTFRFAVDSVVHGFEGKKQHLPGAPVDKVKICFRNKGEPIHLVKRKWYSAEALMDGSYGRN